MTPYLVGIHSMSIAVGPHCIRIHALQAVRRLLVQGHALQALLQRLSVRLLPLLLCLLHTYSAPQSLKEDIIRIHTASGHSVPRYMRVGYPDKQRYPCDMQGPGI